jgi:geranylgeranyl pyrophosphate synthase
MAWASAWAGEEVGSDPKEGVASWSMLYALRDEVQARLLLETRRDETRREK